MRDDDQAQGMAAAFLSQEDEICARAAEESKEAGKGGSGGLRELVGEESSTRIVSAEDELRRARLKNESLTTTLNEFKVRVRNLKKNLEEEELNEMAVLQELQRVKQDTELLKCENKLLRQTNEGVLDDTLREGSCSMSFADQVVKEMKEYVGLTMSVVQRFGS